MSSEPEEKKTALVLSGGGARGAYEAGVLKYIREEFASILGHQPRFDIICGTSVGAVNACYVAATVHESEVQGKRLADIWEGLVLDEMYEIGLRDLLSIPWRFFRGKPLHAEAIGHGGRLPRRLGGFLNTAPMERIVMRGIPWRNICKNFQAGHIQALSVSCTEMSSGKTAVFAQFREGISPQWARDVTVIHRTARIGPTHALASAAIPLLFPAVRVGHSYFCDGGLRQNTPLSPALRLGADRVLVIGLRHSTEKRFGDLSDEIHASHGKLPQSLTAYANPIFLLGKVLDALLLDRTDYDLDRLRLFNALLEGGEKAYGPDFLERINSFIVPVRGAPYRKVKELYIRPSEDIGAIASRHARKGKIGWSLKGFVAQVLKRFALQGSPRGEADLLSYLLFDGAYEKALVHLGMADAAAHREQLREFFSG